MTPGRPYDDPPAEARAAEQARRDELESRERHLAAFALKLGVLGLIVGYWIGRRRR